MPGRAGVLVKNELEETTLSVGWVMAAEKRNVRPLFMFLFFSSPKSVI
jgi:hypothetical protein